MTLGETESKKCSKCGEYNDRGGRARLCSKCMSPKSSTLKRYKQICPECGLEYKGRSKKYCSPYCRNTANNKAKISRAGSKVVSEKKCNKCGEIKPAWEFNFDSSKVDGLSSSGCRKCQANGHATWRAKNPDYGRATNLKKSFGLTIAEYDAMLAAQGGVCALCKKKPTGKRLAVDHDHNTGEIRSLLCHRCNKHKVGSLTLDDVTKIKEYLEIPPARKVFGGARFVPHGKEKPIRRRRRSY